MLSQIENLEMLSVRLFCPKETELKNVEKNRVGILTAEKKKLHSTAYSEREGFRQLFWEEGLWKKFKTKFEFL